MRKTVLIFILLSLSLFLSSCNSNQTSWPGYSGPGEAYEYCHTDERDRAWEEDILFLAEKYLTEHPLVTNAKFHFEIYNELSNIADRDYSNAMYDASRRADFIAQINQLILRIPELSDVQLPYEIQSVVASLEDAHSALIAFRVEDPVIPIFYEPIFSETDGDMAVSLYAVRAPVEYGHILGGKLTAINDMSAEQIIERLTEYVSSGNIYYPAYYIAGSFSTGSASTGLIAKVNALKAIGATEEDADSVTLTFETENGITDCVVTAVSYSDYRQAEMDSLPLAGSDSVMYRHDRTYWYEVLDDGAAVYVRFSAMMKDESQSLDQMLNEVSAVLRDASSPMKLIIDFRRNIGGDMFLLTQERFASAVNQCETDGVYLLINGGSVSAAISTPYLLREAIDGAQLVGEPTAHSVNGFAGAYYYQLPNSGYDFAVGNVVMRFESQDGAPYLQPDVIIHQTWEDYRNGTDTVLEYVLSLS